MTITPGWLLEVYDIYSGRVLGKIRTSRDEYADCFLWDRISLDWMIRRLEP
jgi:hypothetical protein